LRAQTDSVNSRYADNQPRSLFVAAGPNLSRFGPRKAFCHTLFRVFAPHARFVFAVKKIFLLEWKIKFIFFLSLSQLISSLKPAGEGDHKPHVNKL
jgi:hypothetical protein